MIKTCKQCCVVGEDGIEFYKKQGLCKQCARDEARRRMAIWRTTPAYAQWLIDSRELRRSLKEKYRRNSGATPREEIKARAEKRKEEQKEREKRRIDKENARSLLHDAHVVTMRSLSRADLYRWKYRTNPEFNANERMRNQMKKATNLFPRLGDLMREAINRNGKSNQVQSVCGYSIVELKAHIERQFTKRMSWEAFLRGEIHIDHIIPKSSFNLASIDDVRSCWRLSNLRPMWAKENVSKGAKRESLL